MNSPHFEVNLENLVLDQDVLLQVQELLLSVGQCTDTVRKNC